MAGARLQTLTIADVSKTFAGHQALDAFSLEIEGGQFVALLGPSGCGKSTMLNCLAGLMPLTRGRITLDGRRIDTLPPERRGFGMVFQNYALFPHLSVRRNVAFGLQARKVAKSEIGDRVAKALRQVRLEDQADKFPAQLSGGQQQRVAMARAIVIEPALILMDEPLSNLDAQLRTELRTELRRLHQELGLTTVYVTHDQSEALSLADRIVILRSGRTLQVGGPREVYAEPAGAFVAAFMGYRNLLPAVLKERRGATASVIVADGQVVLQGSDRTGGQAAGALVAAVRPEDLRIVPGDAGEPNRLTVRVEVVEYQGNEVAVDAVVVGDQPSAGADQGPVARLYFRTTERLAPRDRVTLTVDPGRLLIFEGAS